MPSQRRIKALGLIILISVLLIYYIRSGASQTRTSDFYTKTVAALNARARTEKENVEALAQKGLRAAEDSAERGKQAVNDITGPGMRKGQEVLGDAKDASVSKIQEAAEVVKGDGIHTPVVAGGAEKDGTAGERRDGRTVTVPAGDEGSGSKSVAGRKVMKDDGVAKVGNTGPKESKEVEEPSAEEAEAKEELNAILKKSPMIIFSKSYCPHSMKAKTILLTHYDISPLPFVVELDQHRLGRQLQDALLKSTGRRTVPNVLVNGKSIGGGDDIQALALQGKLVEVVQRLGGKRIVGVKKVG